jgi:Cu/Ag efflux protein CusF
MKSLFRFAMIAAVIFALGAPTVLAQPAGKKEYAFRGKVEKVNGRAKTLTVNNENIPGWMASMSMDYAVDQADVFKTLKAGDQITAKVYDGDFKTLYDVKVVPPKEPGKK